MQRHDREPVEDLIRRALGRRAGRSALRASDADREATAELLRRAHGEGRLDTDELEERLARCYAAKTLGDLDALVFDLPPARAYEPPPRRSHGWLAVPLAPIVALVVVLAVVSGGHLAWLAWPLAFFVFARFVRARRGWRI